MTDEQAREQARREVDIQRRALDLANAPLPEHADFQEVRLMREALIIFARDQNESFALAELAMRRIEEARVAGGKKCGWCSLVLGEAEAKAFPDTASCQAHVHGCEHNPLVMLTKRQQIIIDALVDATPDTRLCEIKIKRDDGTAFYLVDALRAARSAP